MKRSLLATTALISFVLPVLGTSCALEDAPAPVSSGGKAGSAGSTAQGGSAGSAGSTAQGGTGGSGGSGLTSGAGGTTGGTGGTTGGTGGSAGSSGSGGSGGGAEVITVDTFAGTVNNFGFAWKDSFLMVPCYSVSGVDCLVVQGECPPVQDGQPPEEQGYVFKERFEMGGTVGTNYTVSFKVNGIAEGKYYENGTRQRGADYSDADNDNGTDTFYVGGNPTVVKYNVYKLTVFQPDGVTEVQHYYLNSFPQESTFEDHKSFAISYNATIEVPGGGFVEYLIEDANCRAINNCGPGYHDAECPAPRNVPNEPGLQVPAMYGGIATATLNSVNGQAQPYHAQMIHVTVTDVVAKP